MPNSCTITVIYNQFFSDTAREMGTMYEKLSISDLLLHI